MTIPYSQILNVICHKINNSKIIISKYTVFWMYNFAIFRGWRTQLFCYIKIISKSSSWIWRYIISSKYYSPWLPIRWSMILSIKPAIIFIYLFECKLKLQFYSQTKLWIWVAILSTPSTWGKKSYDKKNFQSKINVTGDWM